MEIVDLQLHEPAPFEDWASADDETRRRVLTEALWQSIDAVGVDAVVLNALEDPGWTIGLARRYPDRIATVPMFRGDARASGDHIENLRRPPEVADVDARIAELSDEPGAVAIRFGAIPSFMPDMFDWYVEGGFDPAFAACERQGVPIWLEVMGGVGSVDRVARSFPELQIIVDHIGLNQPPYQSRDDPPWKDLPITLALGQYENVAIKVCAPIGLSDEEHPWADAWKSIEQLLEAFGPERLAWASDIGRTRGRTGFENRLVSAATADAPFERRGGAGAHIPGPPPDGPNYPGKHTYMDSLAFFLYNDQLTQGEKEQILGRTTRRLLSWPGAA